MRTKVAKRPLPLFQPRVCGGCSERIGAGDKAFCNGCLEAEAHRRIDRVLAAKRTEAHLSEAKAAEVAQTIRKRVERRKTLGQISDALAAELEELARELEQGG